MRNAEQNDNIDDMFSDEQNEHQEIIDKLSQAEKDIMISIQSWLKANRNYRDYDFTGDFKVDKLIPLVKLVKEKEVLFNDGNILQNLREPLELKNSQNETVKTITELKYRTRYQDYELQKMTRGIDISKEPMAYIAAQLALLTSNSKSIVGKLWDVDSATSKVITALYFLG